MDGRMWCALDVGSTTCKYVLCSEQGEVLAREYERHGSKQAEKALEFLRRLEEDHGLRAGQDRIFATGSGAGSVAPHVGAALIQEVVAVAAAVEQLHPNVQFVSEIGGEDMKTIFLRPAREGAAKQVFMQSACSGGTGAFIEKTARKLGMLQRLPEMRYAGYTLHKLSSKCGIFAEADANTLVKAGVPEEEIVASLFEAVVYQNLATLTRGNTPLPEVLLLGGPNLFFQGLQEAWRLHLEKLWREREVPLPAGRSTAELVIVPRDALYYAALGCVRIGMTGGAGEGVYRGVERLAWWAREGRLEEKNKEGDRGLWRTAAELEWFRTEYGRPAAGSSPVSSRASASRRLGPHVIGCDFGSTTAKAVCLSPDKRILFSCYALSRGNPIEDARALFRTVREAGAGEVLGVGITGYGAHLLEGVIGADAPVVETVAHASAALHFFPDADCICDVGGVDVKIMLIRNGTVSDFRLNSQCSSGNGAFLQGVAERFDIPLEEIAGRAFEARSMPRLTMGCGVFLQSDIVNQQRRGWQVEEILAALCAVLPSNVWIYAGGLNNLPSAGRKFVLQGGTHLNLAVVKAQVDFIRSRVLDAEVVVHPYPGEAGAIGAALCALEQGAKGGESSFRGFDAIESMSYRSTTSPETTCPWCPVQCRRTFIDVQLPGGEGRTWSKVPIPRGWRRIITNNSCPKGLVEDQNEVRAVKARMDEIRHAFPNSADLVRASAFARREIL